MVQAIAVQEKMVQAMAAQQENLVKAMAQTIDQQQRLAVGTKGEGKGAPLEKTVEVS